jgi:hypothetical protein
VVCVCAAAIADVPNNEATTRAENTSLECMKISDLDKMMRGQNL